MTSKPWLRTISEDRCGMWPCVMRKRKTGQCLIFQSAQTAEPAALARQVQRRYYFSRVADDMRMFIIVSCVTVAKVVFLHVCVSVITTAPASMRFGLRRVVLARGGAAPRRFRSIFSGPSLRAPGLPPPVIRYVGPRMGRHHMRHHLSSSGHGAVFFIAIPSRARTSHVRYTLQSVLASICVSRSASGSACRSSLSNQLGLACSVAANGSKTSKPAASTSARARALTVAT